MTYVTDSTGRRRLSITKLVALIGGVVGVCATLGKCSYDYVAGSVISLNNRVERLETALMPVLIEFRLKHELERLGVSMPAAPNAPAHADRYDLLRENAEKWASEQVGNKPTKGG